MAERSNFLTGSSAFLSLSYRRSLGRHLCTETDGWDGPFQMDHPTFMGNQHFGPAFNREFLRDVMKLQNHISDEVLPSTQLLLLAYLQRTQLCPLSIVHGLANTNMIILM